MGAPVLSQGQTQLVELTGGASIGCEAHVGSAPSAAACKA